jgi:dipeptidyl-peptidase-4
MLQRSPVLLASLLLAACAGAPPAPRTTEDPRLAGWIERIFGGGELGPRGHELVWIEGGAAYTRLEPASGGGEIARYDARSGARSVVVPASRLVPAGADRPLAVEDHTWSPDGKRLLLTVDSARVWRQNTRSDYWVLDLAGGPPRRLGGAAPTSTLQFAKFAPDGGSVAYVHANDLWIEALDGSEPVRLTRDGSDLVANGTSEWVYEEELGVRDGFRWSPDGTRVAFWRFDQSDVGIYPLVNETDTLYPVVTELRYPKTGTTNPEARIGIVPSAGGDPVFVALPGSARDNYVARIAWSGPDELLVQRLDRRQQTIDVWIAAAATGEARLLLTDHDDAWLDVVDEWQWISGGRELLWVSERDGWRHAWAVTRDGGRWRCLTPGAIDLTEVVGVAGGRVYFLASPEDATRRALYSASVDGGDVKRVTPAEAGTHAYALSPDGKLAVHTVSGLDRPPRIELVDLPGHDVVRVLEDNAAVAQAIAPLLGRPAEFLQVEVEPGVALDAWMLFPPDFDAGKRWPMVTYVYGEPSAVQATDAWKGTRGLFHRALTEAGYLVACIDARGSPAPRGRAWRKSTVGNPHFLAAADQAAAVRKLQEQRPYIDPERVASWGWSGGGTMTLTLLFRFPEVYSVGLAVAPVPDLTLYDTIYQERYMGRPQDNPEGYRLSSPITWAEGLEGDLLLVHGTRDDNVHDQGSQRLINRLVELGKPFELMIYPNRSHAIREGEGTQVHLFSLLARYLQEHLPAGPR